MLLWLSAVPVCNPQAKNTWIRSMRQENSHPMIMIQDLKAEGTNCWTILLRNWEPRNQASN